MIGCGMIACTHLAAMRNSGIDVAGIFSIDTSAAARFAELHQVPLYDSLESLLQDETDLIAVCTPSGTHADLAVTVMEHGKHAVVEKPVALNESDCLRILETEKKTGKFCAPISQLRFSNTYRTVKAAIDAGRFGKRILASLSMKYFRSTAYFQNSWRGTRSLDGGGALMNQGIHGIDMMCGLLGYPVSISGHAATLYHDIEVEDTATASLVFPDGMLGVIDGSTAITHARPRRLEICGTQASVVIEEDVLVQAEGIALTGGTHTAIRSWDKPEAISADLHTAQYKNIRAAICGEEPLYYTAMDAVNTVRVILSIYTSSETGTAARPDFPCL